jgi:hypothetical protein
MKSSDWLRKLAQSPRPGESSLELEPSLFVHLPGGKSVSGAVQLVWIPEPPEQYDEHRSHSPTRMNGWQELEDYIARIPKDQLQHFSPTVRVKANVTGREQAWYS